MPTGSARGAGRARKGLNREKGAGGGVRRREDAPGPCECAEVLGDNEAWPAEEGTLHRLGGCAMALGSLARIHHTTR